MLNRNYFQLHRENPNVINHLKYPHRGGDLRLNPEGISASVLNLKSVNAAPLHSARRKQNKMNVGARICTDAAAAEALHILSLACTMNLRRSVAGARRWPVHLRVVQV